MVHLNLKKSFDFIKPFHFLSKKVKQKQKLLIKIKVYLYPINYSKKNLLK